MTTSGESNSDTDFVSQLTDSVNTQNDKDWFIKDLLQPKKEISWDLLNLFNTDEVNNLDRFYDDLLTRPEPIGRTGFRFKRSGIDGSITSYSEEVKLSLVDNANSSNSLSVNREFTSKSDSVKGKTQYLPFQPGGLMNSSKISQTKDEIAFLHRDEHGLFDIPQGFTRGLEINDSNKANREIKELEHDLEKQKLADDDNGNDNDNVNVNNNNNNNDNNNNHLDNKPHNTMVTIGDGISDDKVKDLPFDASEIDGIVPLDYAAIRNDMKQEKELKKDWAHVVDLDHRVEDFDEVVPNMARKWPFQLDTFQQEAIYHLEQGDSVFVAAHTSAGKTVVAEYAIAMATRNMTKAIYTSPIKALSNQKFRDFKETFKDIDVGLITGDVQINPEANCLIMTTEILRSMLYRGADLIRDVEFVIFDEVHYVNDIDRGVVWEEVIIMLPEHVKYILLSATVPNTFEFANWVGRTKQKDMYVISTSHRPVPLEIFIWAKNDLYKAIDSQRRFLESNFKAHREALEGGKKSQAPNVHMGYGSRGGRGGTARGGNRASGRGNFLKGAPGRDGPNKNTWNSLVHYLKNHNLLPAVIFVFSKKGCEDYADTLGGIDFCTAKEKSEIHMFIDRAVSRLKKEDRDLPQIVKIREMLSRGIAVHHGGLLPIVKEVIEILFSKTLVKVLFATETFAMGLNLPTRTVVFNKTRKHDGKGFRNLLPGEFTQMSGRAGRRGLDATGTVIVMTYNEPLGMGDFKGVTLGTPTKLISQFRLTYNMILNLLRIEALRVEEMIKHSFSENSTQTLLPEHQKKVEKLSEDLKSCKIDDCSECGLVDMSQLYRELVEYEEVYGKMVENIQELPICRTTFLKTGRLICYRDESHVTRVGFVLRSDFAAGVLLILTFDHGVDYDEQAKKYKLPYIRYLQYLCDVFPVVRFNGDFRVDSVPFNQVTFISRSILKTRIKDILQNDFSAIEEATAEINSLLKHQTKWKQASLSLTTQLSLHELAEKQSHLLESIRSKQVCQCPNFKTHYIQFYGKDLIETEILSLQSLISDENLELLPDYEQRLGILRSLGYIDDKSNVLLKGRVACEINSGWELIITELVLDNFLGDFEPEEIVALLSCFVYEGRTNEDEDIAMTPRLDKGKHKILDIMDKLIKVYIENKILLTSEEEEFTTRKRFALMNVVYEWARGLSFHEIMSISVEAEGTIVRVITRLDEICREVKNAALIIGDSTLHSKMSYAQEKIKRDIVFCGSLYL